MRVVDRLRQPPSFSFEFFPPKTLEGQTSLFATLADLAAFNPGFVSVTYGAGGSTRETTLELVTKMRRESGVETVAHLASIGHTREEIADITDRLVAAGITNVLALRGDEPRDEEVAHGSFRHASDLIAFIRARHPQLCIGAACYPEGHLESASRDSDLEHTKRKVDAGADFLVTQLFFDNAFYFHFVERARAIGITCPIVPGIMPVTNFEQIERFTRMCGATIPMRLRLELEKRKGDPDSILQLGVAHATVQCVELLRAGVPGIHFYTLNRSRASRMIVAALLIATSREG